jgi:hypothetical protein
MWSTAERADNIRRNIAGLILMGLHRFDGFAVAELVVFVPKLPVLFDERFDDGKPIRKKLLIFRTM